MHKCAHIQLLNEVCISLCQDGRHVYNTKPWIVSLINEFLPRPLNFSTFYQAFIVHFLKDLLSQMRKPLHYNSHVQQLCSVNETELKLNTLAWKQLLLLINQTMKNQSYICDKHFCVMYDKKYQRPSLFYDEIKTFSATN